MLGHLGGRTTIHSPSADHGRRHGYRQRRYRDSHYGHGWRVGVLAGAGHNSGRRRRHRGPGHGGVGGGGPAAEQSQGRRRRHRGHGHGVVGGWRREPDQRHGQRQRLHQPTGGHHLRAARTAHRAGPPDDSPPDDLRLAGRYQPD